MINDQLSDQPATPASDSPEANADGAAGAPPSNTTPANCKPEPTRILRFGIDSLYVSFYGKLNRNWISNLESLKASAKSDKPEDRLQAQAKIGDHLFEVMDRGSGRFAYVLVDGWFRIAVRSETANSLPLAYVQVSSEVLTLEGLDTSLEQLKYVLNSMAVLESGPHVSRVDLCADFTSSLAMNNWGPEAWISRAQDRKSYTVGREFSGWTIGEGGDVVARLYNKTLEIKRSRKFYLEPLWTDAGWSEPSRVWRIEFQLRRGALTELGVDLVDDLRERAAAIWRYCTSDWLRLSIPNPSDDTPSRWPTHPLWLDLGEGWPTSGNFDQRIARVRKDRIPSDEALFKNGLGGVTSFMASRNITDISEGFGEFLAQAKDFHEESGRGKSFRQYLLDKVLDKGRRFSSIETRRITFKERQALHEDAERYRRAKDGDER